MPKIEKLKPPRQELAEFAGLKATHKRVAEYHVANPEASQGECYREYYPDTTKASARRRSSALFKREDFRLYCETVRMAATAIATASPYFAKLRAAITDPSGMDAIDIVAEMAAGALTEVLEGGTTQEIVNVGIGKGHTEPQLVERPLNHNEIMSARKFVTATSQTFAKEQIKTAPVIVNYISKDKEKPEHEKDAFLKDLDIEDVNE